MREATAAQQLVLDYLEQLDDVGINVPSNVLFAAENGTVCTCGLDALNASLQPEPAWKRAKVGDRVRLREGAKSLFGLKLPDVMIVFSDYDGPIIGIDWCLSAGDYSPSRMVWNDDILEILPPLPETKFGFTVGETVNLRSERYGHKPAIVKGFTDTDLVIRWCHHNDDVTGEPRSFRHGP